MKSQTKSRSRTQESHYWTYPGGTKVFEVGLYYGFTPDKAVAIEKIDRDVAKGMTDDPYELNYIEEKSALLRHYFEKNQPALPVMISYERVPADKKKDPKHCEYSLDILGTPRSVADATLLKAAYEIARAHDFENISIEINTLGDRDSFTRFVRELGSYFRKYVSELDPECRQLMKKSPILIMDCAHEKCQTLKERMPHPINFLSEPSRAHFMEFLEYVEILGIPYSLNHNLIDLKDIASHTLFKIFGNQPGKDTQELIATGSRWSGLAKKLGLKKDIQSVSVSIRLPKPKPEPKLKKIQKPFFYFIQIGQEAKLKSLVVLELLHEAKVLTHHSLTKDKLTAQLASAEVLKVPYIMIMGQKESMDNTILIRDMNNRSQDTVNLKNLPDYLRKIVGNG
jgi:histidyl-tRNA synthetase